MTDEAELLFAESIGACVPACARAQVHSVFLRACNIETQAGELVTLLASGSGNLPHAIRCGPPIGRYFPRLRPGQEATLDGAVLRVPAAGLVLDLSRAAIWNGAVAAVRGAGPQRALRELRTTLREHAPDQGVAAALFFSGRARSTIERALAARMAQSLPRLARATAARVAGAVVTALNELVGLGTGLTPAGDDFIVGYLAALWSRSYRERGVAALLRALADPVAQLSLRTNVISRQMLLDALQGHFAERLTDVVRRVCAGGEVTGAAMRALEVGHSSGADALCGLWFGYAAQTALPIRARAVGIPAGARNVARAAAIAC